jgi:predicted MFS family arabinose efflux permease
MRWLFYLALAPKIAASAIYHTVNIAQLTKQVDEHEYGSILGFEMVLASLARLVSIPLAGLFLQTFDWSGTCAMCAILELIIVILMSLNLVFF